MTTLEILSLLNANVGRMVQVVWDDGDIEEVTVLSVDGEGFVYDLVPPDAKTPYWNRAEEVTNVVPRLGLG